jgi:hypothetical protein
VNDDQQMKGWRYNPWGNGKNSLLQVIDGHVLELDLLGTIDIESIGKNADGHTRTGNVGKLDGTRLNRRMVGY